MTFVLLTESPTPAPAPTEMEPWEVSPGLLGFVLGFFLLALAVVPLFRSMAKHMRRVDHNERLRQAAEEEAAARTAGAAAPPLDADPRHITLEAGPDGTVTGGAGRGSKPDRPAGGDTRPGDGGAARVGQSPTD